MVTPAMQQQPQVIYGPNGQTARLVNGQYVVDAPSPASVPGLIPMETPASRRADAQLDLSGQREERMAAAAEATARQAEITATRLSEVEERQLDRARAAARNSEEVLPDLERFGRMNQVQGSGGLMALPFADRIVGAFDPEAAQMNEITSRLAPQQRPEGAGTTSDTDLLLYLQSSPSIQKPGQANVALIDRGRAEGRRRVAYADFLDRYAEENKTLKGADTAFRAAVDAGTIDLSGNNLRIRDLTPDETPEALAASGRVRGEDGVWRYRRDEQGNPIIPESGGGQPPAGPSGGDNGGLLRPPSEAQVREQTAADRSASGEGFFRKADAAFRGAADFVMGGQSDEIIAGLDTVLPLNGGRAGWINGFPSAYRHNLARERGAADADAADVPVSRGVGQVAGGLMFAPRAAAGAAGRGLVANTVRGTGAGIVYGGAYGFGSGEGNAIERAPDAAVGAGWGAVGGAVAPSLMNVAGRVISPAINAFADGARTVGRPVVNALGDRAPQFLQDAVAPNALTRGLERFAGTNRPDVNALNARRVQLEGDVGRPVAAASTINTGGRAMLRALGTRSDAARETAENFGQGTAEALPARIGGQARRILSNDTRSPDDIRTAIRTERRNTARTTYAEPYAQPVTIDDGLTEALRGPTGRASIQRARADAEANQEWATVADLDRMAEASGGAGGPFPQVSAAAVDYIRQAMSGRGRALSSRPGGARRGAGFQGRADQVDAALENVEGLGPARAAYRDSSRQIEAVDAGERFMGNTPDTVAAAMRDAPESAQAPFRAAAARSIERAAGTTGAAPGVAQRLAIPGTPQRQMMDETLGPDTAQRLAAAARGERDIYRGAQQVDPGVGSQTTNNAMKAMDAAGAVGDLAAGRPLGAVRRVIGMLDSRGFNPQQAEAVLEAMTDPSRADEVIGILADRMSRREARRLTRALRYQLTITPQSGQQP